MVRLGALLALAAVAMATLGWAYQEVHGAADPLRTHSAPAVAEVGTAQQALRKAQKAATAAGGSREDDFQTEISVANQSLAQAASRNVTGDSGRLTLQTVAWLMVTYTDEVHRAQGYPAGSLMRLAYLKYAGTTLRRGHSGIVPRLTQLQQRQRAVVTRQARFGWLRWLAWVTASVLLVALAGLLLETQRYLRRRFRRRINPWLAAATALLVLGVAPLVIVTVQTQAALCASWGELRAGRQAIGETQAEVRSDMNGTHGRAEAIWAVPVEWAMLSGLITAGMWRRLGEYRFQPR